MASFTDLDGWKVGAEDFLAAVLGTAGQPIWVVDADDVIRFANPAAIAALGYDGADELLGRRCHETIHHTRPDGTPFPVEECRLRAPIDSGQRVRTELDWFFRRDGSMFPVSYVSVPVDMPHGRGAVVAFTDIEERRRAEQALLARDEDLEAEQDGPPEIPAQAPVGLVPAGIALPALKIDRFLTEQRFPDYHSRSPVLERDRFKVRRTRRWRGSLRISQR